MATPNLAATSVQAGGGVLCIEKPRPEYLETVMGHIDAILIITLLCGVFAYIRSCLEEK